MSEMVGNGDAKARTALRRVCLTPPEMWSVVWQAAAWVQQDRRESPFLNEYIWRIFEEIEMSEMEAAVDAAADQKPSLKKVLAYARGYMHLRYGDPATLLWESVEVVTDRQLKEAAEAQGAVREVDRLIGFVCLAREHDMLDVPPLELAVKRELAIS